VMSRLHRARSTLRLTLNETTGQLHVLPGKRSTP